MKTSMREGLGYQTVTELPSSRASVDQCAMLYGRYNLAALECEAKDVLEVACGGGIGVGYLARKAHRVIAGDIDEANCRLARSIYQGRSNIEIRTLDAQQLPFEDHSFDTVILFEALYYLHNPDKFFHEAFRVLRPGGKLIISSVNCEWSGFNPSPFSTRYLTLSEIVQALGSCGFRARALVSFPDNATGIRRSLTKFLRWIAVRLRLIPNTMKRKEWLKRLFYGRLRHLPSELPENFTLVAPVADAGSVRSTNEFRIIYAIAERA